MASTSPQIDSPGQCARCQNAVRVQGHAKAGNFPGQFYSTAAVIARSQGDATVKERTTEILPF